MASGHAPPNGNMKRQNQAITWLGKTRDLTLTFKPWNRLGHR